MVASGPGPLSTHPRIHFSQIVAIGNTTVQDPMPIAPYNYYGVQILIR